jgi:predicted nucleic acid-binding protein
MNLIIDANILFSLLIKDGKNAEILISPTFNFYAPEFIFEEIEKYAGEISAKLNRNEEELLSILKMINELVKIIPKEETDKFILEAARICPDEKDIAYFASALSIGCPIWSNDKKLKEQNKIRVYSTEELVRIFNA